MSSLGVQKPLPRPEQGRRNKQEWSMVIGHVQTEANSENERRDVKQIAAPLRHGHAKTTEFLLSLRLKKEKKGKEKKTRSHFVYFCFKTLQKTLNILTLVCNCHFSKNSRY